MSHLDNFIDSINQSHIDNAKNLYIARKPGRGADQHSVSPLTNFVFEFFLFNSLYSVDWESSLHDGDLKYHDREAYYEPKMQRSFVKFCKNQCKLKHAEKSICEAFRPLARLGDLSGHWTNVVADQRISLDQGKRFFDKIAELGHLAATGRATATKATFDLIDDCCYFVYLVRNNIFHGAKSIGEVYQPDQARRIGIYDLFVRCLNSLFFLIFERRAGVDFAQLPIFWNAGDGPNELGIQDVYKLLRMGWLKPEDSHLHWHLFRDEQTSSVALNGTRRALFYPSAGQDILFPLVIGLRYCTDFFFYEQAASYRHRNAVEAIRSLGLMARKVDDTLKNAECFEFESNSMIRRVWLVADDNRKFLDEKMPLAFYFHRGDSEGEGGSGQQWDSTYLPELIKRSEASTGLRVLSDGEPGGLLSDARQQLEEISIPSSHRQRKYYYGVLRP